MSTSSDSISDNGINSESTTIELSQIWPYPSEEGEIQLREDMDVLSLRQIGFHLYRILHYYPYQWKAIVAGAKGEHLVLRSPSGTGKSACFQVVAVYQGGLTIVIVPTKAILKEQVANLLGNKVSAIGYDGDLPSNIKRTITEHLMDSLPPSFLYLTPEALSKLEDDHQILSRLHNKGLVTRFVCDEAHLIEQWASFRPTLHRLLSIRNKFPDIPWTFVSASLTEAEMNVLIQQFHINPRVISGNFPNHRDNIYYEVIPIEEKFGAAVMSYIKDNHPSDCGIIFCQQIQDCERIQRYLQSNDIDCVCYHGVRPSKNAEELQRNLSRWLSGQCPRLVSTAAISHGVDKPDVRYIIQVDVSGSMAELYQATGRAGRDGRPADCIIYFHITSFSKWMQIKRYDPSSTYNHKEIRRAMQEVMEFCADTTTCRRVALHGPFLDTPLQENCGSCDICCTPHTLMEVDVTGHLFKLSQIFQQMDTIHKNQVTVKDLIAVAFGGDLSSQSKKSCADWSFKCHDYQYFQGWSSRKTVSNLIIQLFLNCILDFGVTGYSHGDETYHRCYVKAASNKDAIHFLSCKDYQELPLHLHVKVRVPQYDAQYLFQH